MAQTQRRFETARLFGETSINSIGFAVPGSRWPSLGVAMVSLGSGEFQQTNDMNDELGSFKEGETAWLLTASKSLTPKVALGANFKLVQQTVESFSANGFGVDVGALMQMTPGLKLGASIMNLGGPSLQLRDVQESYPMQYRGGAALALLDGRGRGVRRLGTVLRGGCDERSTRERHGEQGSHHLSSSWQFPTSNGPLRDAAGRGRPRPRCPSRPSCARGAPCVALAAPCRR